MTRRRKHPCYSRNMTVCCCLPVDAVCSTLSYCIKGSKATEGLVSHTPHLLLSSVNIYVYFGQAFPTQIFGIHTLREAYSCIDGRNGQTHLTAWREHGLQHIYESLSEIVCLRSPYNRVYGVKQPLTQPGTLVIRCTAGEAYCNTKLHDYLF